MLLFCLTQSLSFGKTALKKDSILLTGIIFNNEERVKDVVIKIYNKNVLLKSVNVRASNLFKTYIPKNANLTINISAPNFHDKRFFFDTHVPDELKRLPDYKFDIDIYSDKELGTINASLLDFPAGLVKYDKKKKIFIRDKAYTKRMKSAFYQILEEAALAERASMKEHED